MIFNKLLIFFKAFVGVLFRPMCVIVLITHMKNDTNVSDSHFNIWDKKNMRKHA